jgi:hypothetical protein
MEDGAKTKTIRCYPSENLSTLRKLVLQESLFTHFAVVIPQRERLQTRIAAIMVQSLLRMFLKREIVSVCPYSNFLSYTFGSSG